MGKKCSLEKYFCSHEQKEYDIKVNVICLYFLNRFFMSIYLDYSATTPVHPEVAELVHKVMLEEIGNSGSRTHEFGIRAKKIIDVSRQQVADIVKAEKSEVIFTSGATESNNLAILGLAKYGKETGKMHIITTKIEHKSVLEPIKKLEREGFTVSYLDVSSEGIIDLNQLEEFLTEKTLLVSIMHVNNETGSIQPIADICRIMKNYLTYLHIDAAQSFGKYSYDLDNPRIDFISCSGHKVYAPKGIGALISRKRGFSKPPLEPLILGGGQEKGLRAGTLATHLIAGFGLSCQLARYNSVAWQKHAESLKQELILSLNCLNIQINGENKFPYLINFSIPGINSEAAIVMLKNIIAISNGSACTSNSYRPSHVLEAMGFNEERIHGAMRISWGWNVTKIPYLEIKEALEKFRN